MANSFNGRPRNASENIASGSKVGIKVSDGSANLRSFSFLQ